jgi:serine O-acetyltransferase
MPHVLAYYVSKNRKKIFKDLQSYKKYNKIYLKSEIKLLVYTLTFYPEFRNIFYKRVGLLSVLFSFLCPPVKSLYICLPSNLIGGGLYIQHGFSTIIVARSIGENCHINQQVTIGYKKGTPIIGNNVRIAAGAIIVGNIVIGDNSTIGAGCTVVKDVPNDSVVISSPVYYYKKDDKSIKIKL